MITAFKICSGIQTQEGTDSIWKGKYSAWPAPDIGRHRVSFFAKVPKLVGAESGEKLRTGTKRGEKGRKRI